MDDSRVIGKWLSIIIGPPIKSVTVACARSMSTLGDLYLFSHQLYSLKSKVGTWNH